MSIEAAGRHNDEPLTGERIAIVTNVPTHYRAALFCRLGERLRALGAELNVLFLAPPPSTRSWMVPGALRFEHQFLRGVDARRDRGRHVVPFDLGTRLRAIVPSILLSGGFSPAVSGRAARFATRRRIPFGIWSGEIPEHAAGRGRLRAFQRRRLIEHASFAIAYGSLSAEYLAHLRTDLPVVIGRNTTPLPGARRERADGVVELLAVSRAEPYKRLDLAVDAVRTLDDLPLRLNVVGDGRELPSLRDRAAGDERIRILGAVDSNRVGELYRNADVFLFPSEYDPFGLVLVEAMGAGLAVITSPAPGAVPDLALAGENAIVVGGGVAEWAAAIRGLAMDPQLRRRLGAAARSTVLEQWTVDHAAEAMIAGFRLGALATESGRR